MQESDTPVKLVWWWNVWLRPLSPLFNWILSGFPTRQVLFLIQHTRFQRIFQHALWVAVINFKLNLSALCSVRGTGPQRRGRGRLSLAGTLTVCWLLAAPRLRLLEALDGISYIVLRLPKSFHMYLLKLRVYVYIYIQRTVTGWLIM